MKPAAIGMLWLLLILGGCAGGSSKPPVDNARAADANAALGMDFLRRGDYQRALEALLKAHRFDRDHVQANWGLGLSYSALAEPDQARDYFEKAVRLAPRPDILNSYGAFLCEQGDVAEAVTQFERAADHPRYTRPALPLTNAGLCLFQANRLDDADLFYRRALAAEPRYVAAIGRLAELRYAQGQYAEARSLFQRADGQGELSGELLLQAARTELALDHHGPALNYLRRYNLAHPGRERTLGQISRPGER